MASWIAIAVNILAGIGWLISFTRFLRAADDLWRTIIQDALAASLGVGWVIGFGYIVADAAGLITSHPNVALFPVLMAVTFLIALSVGWFRYR